MVTPSNYFGFVYIWYDTKNKMFYIGSRKGKVDDGYICSSKWMKAAYIRRPETFTRRIISVVHNNEVEHLHGREKVKYLHAKEQHWLDLINTEQLGIKYYNLKPLAAGGHGTGIPCSELTKQRISNANKGRVRSEELKQLARKISTGKKYPIRRAIPPEAYLKSSIKRIKNIFPMFDPEEKFIFSHKEYGVVENTIFGMAESFPNLLTNSLVRLVFGDLKSTGKWKLISSSHK